MPFTFKQFHIDDQNCGMPVSTDGVLLGAWSALTEAKTILDIGAGSGLLSLMAAQRSQALVTAVELDEVAAQVCHNNIQASPWANRINTVHMRIQQFSELHAQAKKMHFEHIVCNPPYFKHGPVSSNQQRAQARHTDSLSFTDLLNNINALLSDDGNASLILPTQSLTDFLDELANSPLQLQRHTLVSHSAKKPAHRHLLEINKAQDNPPLDSQREDQLFMRDEKGHYTKEMRNLTQDFYLNL